MRQFPISTPGISAANSCPNGLSGDSQGDSFWRRKSGLELGSVLNQLSYPPLYLAENGRTPDQKNGIAKTFRLRFYLPNGKQFHMET
jgi:hypothetical protein